MISGNFISIVCRACDLFITCDYVGRAESTDDDHSNHTAQNYDEINLAIARYFHFVMCD